MYGGTYHSTSKVSYVNSILSLVAVALGAGAAGTLNMWYESDLDALMTRTCLRPIPTGQVTKNQALLFGTMLTFGSVSLLYFSSNLISASLLLFTIGFLLFHLHSLVKKKNSAKYCYWRSCRSVTPSNWMDYSYRNTDNRTFNFILNNFFMDTFSLLGVKYL